jgi:hypothetical protein
MSEEKSRMERILETLERVAGDDAILIPEDYITGSSWIRMRNSDDYVVEKIRKVDEIVGGYFLAKVAPIYTTILGRGDFEIVKVGWQLGVKRYAKEPRIAGVVGYEEWEGYEGLGRDRSLELNDFLWDMAFNKRRFGLDELKREVVDKFGIDEKQAENIIRTEFANIFNKMREWAYLEKTKVRKFRWVAKADACEKCKAVEAASKSGVSLERLKELVKEYGGRYAREWSVHPQCRCSFTRAKGSVGGWERV